MHVFVLGTGRCGTTTFAKACGHITNFSTGHETSIYAWPENHIEVNNRLSFATGNMPVCGSFFVHLTRNLPAVTASYSNRWSKPKSIVHAWPIVEQGTDRDWAMVTRMVVTMHANIKRFLQSIPSDRKLTVDIDDPKSAFRAFWARIGAEGDLYSALAEFDVRYNASL